MTNHGATEPIDPEDAAPVDFYDDLMRPEPPEPVVTAAALTAVLTAAVTYCSAKGWVDPPLAVFLAAIILTITTAYARRSVAAIRPLISRKGTS